MRYYIFKDEPKELIKEINGSYEDAYNIYIDIIKKQQYEYHIAKTMRYWRVIELRDENNKLLAWEK